MVNIIPTRPPEIILIGSLNGYSDGAERAIGVLLHKAKGMTNILGLMHAPWLVAVYFLLTRIVAEGVSGLYSIWMLAALIMSLISPWPGFACTPW